MLDLMEYWESPKGNEPAMTNKIFMHPLSPFHLVSSWGWLLLHPQSCWVLAWKQPSQGAREES